MPFPKFRSSLLTGVAFSPSGVAIFWLDGSLSVPPVFWSSSEFSPKLVILAAPVSTSGGMEGGSDCVVPSNVATGELAL